MVCDLNQYRAQIGLYNSSHKYGFAKKFKVMQNKSLFPPNLSLYLYVYINILFYIIYASITVYEITKNYILLKTSSVCYIYISS